MTSNSEMTPVLEQMNGDAYILTLNRPRARNAIDLQSRSLISSGLEYAEANGAKAVILTGTDPAFCAGVDFRDLQTSIAVGPPSEPNPAAAIRACRIPVIAAVNGACVTGGLEMALSCDFIVASDRATFADRHAQYNLTPGPGMWGMSALLPEAVGRRKAKELSGTGRFVSADEALSIGLVNEVVPHDGLLEMSLKIVQQLSRAPADVIRAWFDTYDAGAGVSLETALELERNTERPLGGESSL